MGEVIDTDPLVRSAECFQAEHMKIGLQSVNPALREIPPSPPKYQLRYTTDMNMFKKVKADSVESYLASIPDDRKEIIEMLHSFIQKTVPSLKPHFAYNMLGYGSFPYKNYKKEMIDWPVVALANQKNYVSLYVCAVDDGQYIAEKYKDQLGNVSIGKSCIRFKKKEDIHLDVLKKVLLHAAKNPGLVGAGEHKKPKKKS